ncbi:MAG: UPF0179 family protein [Methanobrevibacter sp.]|jgi:uncharacterized protein (UPF0179 family)|nr:UPF0179 family protein [Candidatus Methanovirga aequatorialis]
MITLIGEDLAKKDLVFLFNKAAEECDDCKFKTSCVESLEEGRKYKILDVRDNQQPCPIHDKEKVNVVEVEKANITTFIDVKKSFQGSTVNYTPPDCNIKCIYHEFCFPDGLKESDKCTIEEVIDDHINECAKGYSLSKVVLKIKE